MINGPVIHSVPLSRSFIFLYFSTFAVQRNRAISGLERAMERERQSSDELDALRESALRAEKLERDTEALRHKCLRAEQRAVDSEVVRICLCIVWALLCLLCVP